MEARLGTLAPLAGGKAEEILRLAGVAGQASLTPIKENNHVYRLQAARDVFFLKTYTKSWYGDDVPKTAGCVRHEASAWAILTDHGLAAPDVVLARPDCDNPLGRPFIVTRALRGRSLVDVLRSASRSDADKLLRSVGDYLRRMHAITFAYPGYLMDRTGPRAPLDPGAWQHRCWTARRRQQVALAGMDDDVARLSSPLVDHLRTRLSTIEETLAPAGAPPRFVHGDCHAHQFFLDREGEDWHVSGVLDLEVASAGDCGEDLMKFAIEMAARFPVTMRWWEPLFLGYGGEPDFELFRLRLLGASEADLTCHGAGTWPGTREEVLTRLATARDWADLFTTREPRAGRNPPHPTSQ
jgi:Ser/Thr protein kinase RdoA (MazF antagonist)